MSTDFQKVEILSAGEEDLAAIRSLATTIWHACYPGITSQEQIDYMLRWMYSPDTLRSEILSQGICYDRLLLDNEFIGFASYGPTENPQEFKMHKLYLSPAFHGKGLGSLLLRHCEREVRKLGAQHLILNVNKQNTKAITAYQRNGFRIAEAVVKDIGGGFVMDDFVMTKELSPLMR